jgi:hypothetical protein
MDEDENEEDFRPPNLFMSIRVHPWLNAPGKYGFKETRPALPRIRGQ